MTRCSLVSTLLPLLFLHLHLRAARGDAAKRYMSCERVGIACLGSPLMRLASHELNQIERVATVRFARMMIRGRLFAGLKNRKERDPW